MDLKEKTKKEAFKKGIKDFYNWYLGFLTILTSLPIIAPILLKLGLELPAKVIYFIYGFFCHQFAGRSLHLFDYQYAWCSRDTGIWIGVTLVAWLMKFKRLKSIKWYWAIPFIIPMALDGGLQTIFTVLSIQPMGIVTGQPVYISNNLLRFVTGVLFGIGISLWISGSISNQNTAEVKEKKKEDSQLFKIAFVFIASMFIYIGMVQLWGATSKTNAPADFVDFVARTPQKDFFIRRGDALCPTKEVNDLFRLDCFFEK